MSSHTELSSDPFVSGSASQGESQAKEDERLQGLRRLKATLLPYAVGMSAALAAASAGLAEMWQAGLLVAYTATGLAIFFALLCSGATLRWRDPMLVFPQVLFGIGLVALSYGVMEIARGVALQWLCLIMVFDMRRLPGRQTFIAACCAMVLPAVGLLATWDRSQHGRLEAQVIFLILGAVMVPVLLLLASIARKLHARRARQYGQMGRVLEQMQRLSIRDGLSGLFNRRHMQERLNEECRRQNRSGRPAVVAILDIDLFKRVNDRYGHAVGDLVIKTFAALGMVAFDRSTDVLARWGGEEFLLLLPETSEAEALPRLLHLRRLVHAYDWTRHHPGLKVTFSAGTGELAPGCDLLQVIEQADQALYRAKEGGRDRVMPSSPCPPAGEGSREAPLKELAQADCILARQQELSGATEASSSGDNPVRTHSRNAAMRWIMGPDPNLHPILRSCLVALGNYTVLSLAVIFYGIPRNILSLDLAYFFLAVMAIGGLVPYALVRIGATARLEDRAIMVPQMWWAGFALGVLYATLPESRSFALQMMCVTLVFSFIDSRSRQAFHVGAAFAGPLVFAYLYLLAFSPPGFHPVRETLGVLASCFILWQLTLQSRDFARARERTSQQRQELAAASKQVFELMTQDALTGLLNRQYLQALLERECARHEQAGHPFSVVLMDLDHFKRINDTYGHRAGDEVLAGFARTAKAFIRMSDTLGRWGGEEFLLILPETETESNGLRAAERLREHVIGQRFSPSLPELAVTFSAGVATHLQGESASGLLERADEALYRAKRAGRNACVLAQPSS